MRVDWCVSSWFRIKNTHSHSHEVVGQWVVGSGGEGGVDGGGRNSPLGRRSERLPGGSFTPPYALPPVSEKRTPLG